jgi:hypothetical protein
VSLEARPNFLVCTKFRVARNREGDPDHWIQTWENRWIRISTWYHILGGSGFERVSFRLQNSQSVERRGLVQTCAHPVGGDHVVDRWCSNNAQRKVEAGDKWRTHVTWEEVNPLLTYHVLGIHEGGAQGLNAPTHEVVSCEGC